MTYCLRQVNPQQDGIQVRGECKKTAVAILRYTLTGGHIMLSSPHTNYNPRATHSEYNASASGQGNAHLELLGLIGNAVCTCLKNRSLLWK
jgi:hypothetical protein